MDIRLLVLLWHIAERWGEHDENGAPTACVVPVHLTHQIVASLISAQRPTVTSALAALTERGLISRRPDGLIVLHGEPPDRVPAPALRHDLETGAVFAFKRGSAIWIDSGESRCRTAFRRRLIPLSSSATY